MSAPGRAPVESRHRRVPPPRSSCRRVACVMALCAAPLIVLGSVGAATAATAHAKASHHAAGASATKSASMWPAAAAALRAIAIAEDERRWSDGELARLLGHPDAAVRARAALAVGRLQDSTSVTALMPLARDRDRGVREEAVFALGQVGHRTARPALESALADTASSVRALAIEALGKLGDRGATAAVVRFLGDRSPELRGEAAVALWRLADSTALEPLLARAQDPDAGARWRVIYALEKLAAPARVVPVASAAATDSEWLVRAYAARTLGREKSPLGTPALLRLLDDREVAVEVNALRALQLVADSTCAPCLGAILHGLEHPDPYLRVTAAIALGDRFAWTAADTVERAAAVDTLAAHLADPDAATRGAAAKALAARVGADALKALQPLLDDPSVYTRVAALQALATLPPASAAPLLRERARAGHATFERMTALDGLGALRTPEARDLVRATIADSSVLVAAEAASALGDMGDTASVPLLAAQYAARALEAEPDARQSIRDALRQLAGRAYADSIERVHAPAPAKRAYPADFEKPSPVRGAVLHTSRGDITWEFYRSDAVQTVKNFVTLAQRGYFDGLAVHRVVPNFVIQDGDPTGTGSGGPGYTIRCEYNRRRYEPGMVGMALSGKDTGGSQWFITHSPQPHLDGRYTIFAHVTSGMDVVHEIVQGDRILRVELLK